DALRTDLAALVPKGSRLVGNLPYYVSSPLLRLFLNLREHVTDLHVMLQEEVARRVAASPGSREYGILSVLYAAWAETDGPLPFPPLRLRPRPQGLVGGPPRPVPPPAPGRDRQPGCLRRAGEKGLRETAEDT